MSEDASVAVESPPTPKERRKEYDWMSADSADHDANHDGMWCNNPEETAAFMQSVARPSSTRKRSRK